jgi:CPA1 family monovalent cation:H+ antiporter
VPAVRTSVSSFDVAAVLLAVTGLLAYLNVRTLRLPPSVAMLIAGLLGAVAMTLADRAMPQLQIAPDVEHLLRNVDFSSLLLNGFLGFLLFAGSLTVNFEDLRDSAATVFTLATFGVLISTAIIGTCTYFLVQLAGVTVPLVYCLIFGALISPTDPVAVLAIMQELHMPRRLHINFTGESLLNDGVGVIVYTVLLAIATSGSFSAGAVALLFVRQVVGGVTLGIAAGLLLYAATNSIDEPNIEVQLSVALVTAVIAVAPHLGVSGPLACVVAGIFVGNRARHRAMRDETTAALDRIWSFADHLMNALLFLILGLEAAVFRFASPGRVIAVLLVIAVVLGARFVSVALPLAVMRRHKRLPRGTIRILTWGGLRGGISVALALSLPEFPHRHAVLNVTYGVVVFSVLVQGLTIEPVIRRFTPRAKHAG